MEIFIRFLERTCPFMGTGVEKAGLWFGGAADYNKGEEWSRVDSYNVCLWVITERVKDRDGIRLTKRRDR